MNKRILSILVTLLCLFSLCACDELFGAESQSGTVSGRLEVHFLDVGQADSALLLCDGESLLIDGGNSEDSSLLYSYLRNHGVKRLDCIIATHPHEDHVGGIIGALSYVNEVGTVYSPVAEDGNYFFNRMASKLKDFGVSVTVPSVGDRFRLGEAEVVFLGPVELKDDVNQNSLVCKVNYGEVSFLFTGDAERPAEKKMLETGEDLSATVLKVGHHGSASSTCYEFLRAVNPSYAVISCERNNSYGHPDDGLLSRLKDEGAEILRTDRSGHIVFTTDGAVLSVETEKEASSAVSADETGEDGEPYMYVGNISSKKYHRPDCSGLPSEKNTVYFYSLEEAIGAGFTPCGLCKPE